MQIDLRFLDSGMITDAVAADERIENIGYTDMKKTNRKHLVFMICVVLVQLTAGFGLYQNARGDENGCNERLYIESTGYENA